MEILTDEKLNIINTNSENNLITNSNNDCESNDSSLKTIQGMVIFKRSLGKKLEFFDVLSKTLISSTINNMIPQKGDTQTQIIIKESKLIGMVQVGMEVLLTGSFITDPEKPNIIYFSPCTIKILSYNKENKQLNNIRHKATQLQIKPQKERALCKMFKKTGECNITDCIYRHFYLDGETIKLKRQAEMKAEALNKAHEDDPLNPELKLKHGLRHSKFADFLVNIFTLERLQSGHILDIAGGKGLVSFCLAKTYNLKCIIVDPRGVTLPKKEKKAVKKNKLDINEIREEFNIDFVRKDLIDSASIIIGMHPDEATVDIVKTAIMYKKPFAVVPCCVFPGKFPDRSLKNGDKVVDYTQLVKYIQEMVESSQVSFLNIEGRNKVIFNKEYS